MQRIDANQAVPLRDQGVHELAESVMELVGSAGSRAEMQQEDEAVQPTSPSCGRGTFVETPRLEQGPRELTSFGDEMRRRRLSATSTVLEHGVMAAPPDIAAILAIAPADPVFRLRRVRLADSEPMGVQTAFLPIALVPGIEQVAFEDTTSLYDVLHTRYGLQPASARETHKAVLIGSIESAWLRVAAGSPAMAAERVAYLADARPLEYVQSIMRGDRYQIALDLVRTPATR